MAKNVLLPMPLLERIIELLECWNTSGYDRAIRDDYSSILWELGLKMQKLELRDSYMKIIRAKDEDSRHSARMEYLWRRNQIRSASEGDAES